MKYSFVLIILILVSQLAYAQSDRGIEILTIKKDIVLIPTVKFRYFAKGKIVSHNTTSPSQMQTAYCAFENSKMENKTIKADTVFDIKMKKMNFPNKNIVRYSLIESPTKSLQVFCDFTNLATFSEKKLRASVNRQFGAWARVTHQ